MQAAACHGCWSGWCYQTCFSDRQAFIASPLPGRPQIVPLLLLDARRCLRMTSRYPCPKVACGCWLSRPSCARPLGPGSGTEAAGREPDGWICSEEPLNPTPSGQSSAACCCEIRENAPRRSQYLTPVASRNGTLSRALSQFIERCASRRMPTPVVAAKLRPLGCPA